MNCIKSFILTFLILASFCFANEEFIPISKKKSVYSYEERYYDVAVKGSATSSITKCLARIDINLMLVEAHDCDITVVSFYSSAKMWIGNLRTRIFGGKESFSAGYSYHDIYADFRMSNAAYMTVTFGNVTKPANLYNLSSVTCPKGMIKEIDGIYAVCRTPYKCPAGQYAVDDRNCDDLPAHAKRRPKEGFVCESGYLLTDGETCIKKVACSKPNLYDAENNECYILPKNAKWNADASSEDDYECISGYSFDNDAHECRKELTTCGKGKVLSEDRFSCEPIPGNAHKESETSWNCDEGYGWDVDDNLCKKILDACEEDSVLSADYLACSKIPLNAHKVSPMHWACDDGYKEKDDECRLLAKCESNQYYVNEFSCAAIPSNAHLYGRLWVCDDGYFQQGEGCAKIPNNAHALSNTAWVCDRGYFRDDDQCLKLPEHSQIDGYGEIVCDDDYVFVKEYPDPIGVCRKRADCNDGQYRLSDFVCEDLPENTVKIQEDQWTCKSGYILTANATCEKKADCGWRKIYESSTNTCKTIPWHAEKYNDFDWRCKDGYSAYYGDDGEIVCKRKKYDHNNDYAFEADILLGGLMDSTVDDQSFGIGVGFEWVWGSLWNIGPAVELGFMYADYPDNMSYYSARLDLAFMCAYGAKAFQFYLRPLVSFNLGTHVEYESYIHQTSNYYVHGAVGGLEIGGRLRDIFKIPLAFDLFFRFTSVMFEDNVVGGDTGLFTLGLRTLLF